MLEISAKERKEGENKKETREKGGLPAVLYGYQVENTPIVIDYQEFDKLFKEAGESSLIDLKIQGDKKDYKVLVHDIQRDPLSGEFIHVDFYQPSLTEETEANIPLVFEGTSEAVEQLGGTLVKNIDEVEVKAFPQNLPHEIKVSIDSLKTFDDYIKISDLVLPDKVKILEEEDRIVASISSPTKVEEELETPAEEKPEEIERVKEGKEDKEGEEEGESEEK
jgi:large subunit ribosomal protein L25